MEHCIRENMNNNILKSSTFQAKFTKIMKVIMDRS